MTAMNRRRALTGSAAIVVGVPVLAACGSGDEPSTDPSSSTSPSPSDASPSEPSTDGTATPSAAAALATTSSVPVGGCFVNADAKVVVTQPTEGDFKAFSAVCTHQGCLVESSSDGEIPCPCHLSHFSLEDGSPISGPASSPLAPVEITVDGDSITQA
jgi:Rieske Fe-S protein